ncbi:MFS transporter [Hippea jasoniae]|uniref:MFS transporter n=1 Tax=Hippea jasoniae TaxID=944479 RepID=UPI00055142B8|nr:MFS transporter [Hippea jasoniae]
MKNNGLGFVLPLVVFLGGIGGGIVFPILPVLSLQFGLSAFFIGLIISANKITRIFVNQFVGLVIDSFGGKTPLVCGLLLESLGSIFYVISLYICHGWLMLAGRVIWGVGSAFVFISANTIALNRSTRKNRGQFTAKVRIALSLGVPAGLVIGGIFSSLFSNLTAFLLSVSASFIGAFIVLVFFKEEKIEKFKASFKLKESFGFIIKNPDLAVISTGNLLTFFSVQGVVMATLVIFLSFKHIFFFVNDARFSSGIAMSIMMVSSGLAGVIASKIIDKLAIRSIIGFPAVAIVICGFILLGIANTALDVLIALIMIGVSVGINNITLLSILGDFTTINQRGRAVGLYQLLGDIGGSLGPLFGIEIGIHCSFKVMYILTAVIFAFNLFVFGFAFLKEKKHKNEGNVEFDNR